jgi:sarcosine oxidase subunit gamma
MADTLERTSPLQPWAPQFARLPNSVAIVEEPFVTMVDLRVGPLGSGRSGGGGTARRRAANRRVHLREKR